MTMCRYLSVLVALGFLTVCAAPNAEAAVQAEEKCPRVSKSCDPNKHKDICYHKFTVRSVVDDKTLKVQYPETVFSVTMKPDIDDPKEKDHKEKNKGQFTISVKKPATPVEQNKTYLMKRCPDSVYEIDKEIAEDDDQ